MARNRRPLLRGVVEGYYGRPWTGEARRDVIRFMGRHGLDTFVYGPKNDPYHRDRWREPYPKDDLADLRATARTAEQAKVRFVYALSPGIDICFARDDDFAALTRKLRQLVRASIRQFALFFDDLFDRTIHPEDVERYGGSDGAALARAHADLTNRVDRWLRAQRLPGLVLIVPSDYEGIETRPYHTELAARLRRRIPIGWTGSGVFAATLTAAEARARRAAVGDHPVVLWDNFPVNDTILSSNLHLGPLTGRDGELARTLAGHLLNPMPQAHASLVGLGTAAAYFRDPDGYDAEAAWQATLAELDPGGGLAILAAQTRSSPLDLDDARDFTAAVERVAASYAGGEWNEPMTALETEIAHEAAAPRRMSQTIGGTPLAHEIAPWVEELAAHAASAADAVALLRAMKPHLRDLRAEVAGGRLYVSGLAVPPDRATVARLGPVFATPPAAPELADLVQRMGGSAGLVSAEIRFCPELGLNVHGKALYAYPRTSTELEVVTGRNAHHRLLAFVAERYADHLARRRPEAAAVLRVTLDGAAVPLGPGGRFEAALAMPASGRARVVVTTAAGDATAACVP